MDDANRDHPSQVPAPHRRRYPLFKVLAAVAPTETGAIVTALRAAGFGDEAIEVVTAKDMTDWDEPVGGGGLRGFVTRLGLSAGGDLETLERARQEIAHGHALVLVQVHGDAEQDRAHAILREHGGHAMSYFGRWTITTLEGGTP